MGEEKKQEKCNLLIEPILKPKIPVQGEPLVLSLRITNIGKVDYTGGKIKEVYIFADEKSPEVYVSEDLPEIRSEAYYDETFEPIPLRLSGKHTIILKMEKEEAIFYRRNVVTGTFQAVGSTSDYSWSGEFWVESRFEHWQKETTKEMHRIADESKTIARESVKLSKAVIWLTFLLFFVALTELLVLVTVEAISPIHAFGLAIIAMLATLLLYLIGFKSKRPIVK